MRLTVLARLLAVISIAAALGVLAAPGAGAAAVATLDPVNGPVRAGDVIPVTGDNWPVGQMVSVSVCGNNGVNGSASCALSEASTFPITRDGTLSGRVYVTTPPAPCPCVLKVVSMGATAQKQTPLLIDGAPWSEEVAATTIPETEDQAPPETFTPPDPTLRIDSVTIEDTSGRGVLFGASPTRLLRLTVTNTGELPVANSHMSLRYGKGDDPDMVVETPEVPTIAAGQTITVEIPFELGAIAYGDYTVAGDIGVVGNRVAFEGETSSWPWGLLVVVIVLVQLVVILVLRRNRRLRRQREAELLAAGGDPETVGDPELAGVAAGAAAGGAASTAGDDGSDPEPSDDPGPTAAAEPDTTQDAAVGAGESAVDPESDVADNGEDAVREPAPAPDDIRLDGPVTAAPWH